MKSNIVKIALWDYEAAHIGPPGTGREPSAAIANLIAQWGAGLPKKATELHWQGADLREIQKLLGHVNLNTTAIYTEVYPDDLDQAIGKLSADW